MVVNMFTLKFNNKLNSTYLIQLLIVILKLNFKQVLQLTSEFRFENSFIKFVTDNYRE